MIARLQHRERSLILHHQVRFLTSSGIGLIVIVGRLNFNMDILILGTVLAQANVGPAFVNGRIKVRSQI